MIEKLTKNKNRIKYQGEVFTPKWLVVQSVENIQKQQQNIFIEKEKTFFDPSCGNGNLLIEVVNNKIKNGSSAWEALSTTFGVDIMEDNVLECRQRLLEAAGVKQKRFEKLVETTIVQGNTLKTPIEVLFKKFIDNHKQGS